MITDNLFLRHTSENRRFVAVKKPSAQRLFPGGAVGETLSFLSENFLKDRKTWALFTEQFRTNADSESGGWRCEYWGKMMRGAALVCAVTKDAALYAVLRETAEDLLAAQDELGRISSYAPEQEFTGWDLWGRKYVLLGFLHFLDICDDANLRSRILHAMQRHADYIVAHIGPAEDGKRPIGTTSTFHRGMNSLSILEPMVLLYEKTGAQRYLDFAAYLVEQGDAEIGGIFRDALEDEKYPYQYSQTKAYEMISCFEGLLEYARITHSQKWVQAVRRFAYRFLEAELSVIGSAGCYSEYLDHANARQTSALYRGVMQETCVTVTWMKFCARMLRLTGDPVFADCFEQSLENAYLGAVNTELRQNADQISPKHFVPGIGIRPRTLPFDSYAPLLRGRRGLKIGGVQSMRGGEYYGCCACIGAAGIGLAPQLSVLPSENGFAVELYFDTVVQTATASGNPVSFTLTGGYPVGNEVKLAVSAARPETFDLALRIPSWSEKTELLLNRKSLPVTPGMTVVRREWGAHNEIIIRFDMRVEALRPVNYGADRVQMRQNGEYFGVDDVQTPGSLAYAALRRGPLVLARDARLGEGFAPVQLGEETYMDAESAPAAELPFAARCRMRIAEKGGATFSVIDYSSAGKTWSEDSETEAWIPTR